MGGKVKDKDNSDPYGQVVPAPITDYIVVVSPVIHCYHFLYANVLYSHTYIFFSSKSSVAQSIVHIVNFKTKIVHTV